MRRIGTMLGSVALGTAGLLLAAPAAAQSQWDEDVWEVYDAYEAGYYDTGYDDDWFYDYYEYQSGYEGDYDYYDYYDHDADVFDWEEDGLFD